MRFRWKGIFLSGNVELFIFATQGERFGILDPKMLGHIAKSLKKDLPLGLLGGIAVEVWRAIPMKTKGTKAFGVMYQNPEGHKGTFFAIAPSEVVDEIFAVIPSEKLSDYSKPKS